MLEGQKILILYGSQTGTSATEAVQLFRVMKYRNMDVRCSSLAEFNFVDIVDEECILFLLSTAGEGNPPHAARPFYQSLMLSYPTDVFDGLTYAVFGFGDSRYEKFNYVARTVDARLTQLGAQRLLPLALGDDSKPNSFYSDYEQWVQKWIEETPITSWVPPFTLVSEKYEVDITRNLLPPGVCEGEVNKNFLLTAPEHFQKVYRLSVSLPEKGPSLNTGDVCLVYYRNNQTALESLAHYLSPNWRTCFVHITCCPQFSNPITISLKNLLESYLDIGASPSFYLVKSFARLAQSELHAERLEELSYEDYLEYVVKEKRKIWEVLYDFGIGKLPLTFLLEFVKPISPREYSIASAPHILAETGQFELLFSVLEYLTPYKRLYTGLCTGFLAELKPGQRFWFSFRQGHCSYPQQADPMLFVSTGTGISPHLALLRELNEELTAERCLVFYGCRNREKDFTCGEELESLSKAGKIQLFTAFSRDQSERIYVQHVMAANRPFLTHFLRENSAKLIVMICGNSKFLSRSIEK